MLKRPTLVAQKPWKCGCGVSRLIKCLFKSLNLNQTQGSKLVCFCLEFKNFNIRTSGAITPIPAPLSLVTGSHVLPPQSKVF